MKYVELNKKYYNILNENKKYFKSEKNMDILEKILNNPELAEKIRLKCDIELYPELQDLYDEDGHITWNIEGKAFGADGSGGEFVLLSDGTIGFNSSEGETGRIAENMKELFSLLVNCPCFFDFFNDRSL